MASATPKENRPGTKYSLTPGPGDESARFLNAKLPTVISEHHGVTPVRRTLTVR